MPSASQILEIHWKGKLPVDVCQLARVIGVEVHGDPNMPEVVTVSRQPGGTVIAVNTTQTPARQRFAVAHALGHVALGHLTESVPQMHDGVSSFSSQAAGHQEQEANNFAVDLLMPARALRYALDHGIVKDVAQLVRVFGVSQVAVRHRLRGLGLISD